ncbi:tetratricopeptide repeat protein, partial [bacterium]|nr:tetratricopeptide repeat protein [bacterium]
MPTFLRHNRIPGTAAAIRTVVLIAACAAVLCAAYAGPVAAAEHRQDVRPSAQAYLHYSLGRLMEVSGALSDALVQYRRADSLDPGHCELSNAVARTLHALGKIDEASAKSAMVLQLCPDDPEALAIRAQLLLVQGEFREVEELLASVALDHGGPREFAALYGQALLSQGRIEDGAAYLRSRSEADSLNPRIASMHGRVLLLLGDSEGAVSEFRRSARLDPGNRVVTGMLSRLLIAIDRPEEGVPMLEWIHSRYEAVEPGFISLAAGYSLMGESDRAQAILDTATVRFGDTAAILRARGATYFGADDFDNAIDAYERLLEIDENSVTALNFIAYTLADENRDLDRALEYAKRAVELEEGNPLLRDTLGWAHFRLGNMEQARRELDLSVELGGDNPVI